MFTPGRAPTVTLVEDHLVKLRELFEDALKQGGVLINISGPSKSGKTVFVKNIVGGENLISVTGAGVKAERSVDASLPSDRYPNRCRLQ